MIRALWNNPARIPVDIDPLPVLLPPARVVHSANTPWGAGQSGTIQSAGKVLSATVCPAHACASGHADGCAFCTASVAKAAW